MITAKDYALAKHAETNHYYDEYLPYEFHLRMVNKVAEKFMHLVSIPARQMIVDACWMHDLIEDCRVSYNDIRKHFDELTAEIVRAVTNNNRGRNRFERMPMYCYEDIRNTPYACFVKLCDRIANVQYSKMTGSKMFEMYKKENIGFKSQLCINDDFTEMWDYLETILAA